jgi:hypothetical protein
MAGQTSAKLLTNKGGKLWQRGQTSVQIERGQTLAFYGKFIKRYKYLIRRSPSYRAK